jgi:hypothetical protein
VLVLVLVLVQALVLERVQAPERELEMAQGLVQVTALVPEMAKALARGLVQAPAKARVQAPVKACPTLEATPVCRCFLHLSRRRRSARQ